MSKKVSRQVMRHSARRYAMQALYQWHYTQDPVPVLIDSWRTEHDFSETDEEYFALLVQGVVSDLVTIQTHLQIPIKRELSDITPVDLSILRLAIYELMHRLDIPYKVIINEAVELSKEFSSDQSFKFVNGVLDKLVPSLRAVEIASKKL